MEQNTYDGVADGKTQFFQDRLARADSNAFDRIMNRPGGKPPIGGDQVPNS